MNSLWHSFVCQLSKPTPAISVLAWMGIVNDKNEQLLFCTPWAQLFEIIGNVSIWWLEHVHSHIWCVRCMNRPEQGMRRIFLSCSQRWAFIFTQFKEELDVKNDQTCQLFCHLQISWLFEQISETPAQCQKMVLIVETGHLVVIGLEMWSVSAQTWANFHWIITVEHVFWSFHAKWVCHSPKQWLWNRGWKYQYISTWNKTKKRVGKWPNDIKIKYLWSPFRHCSM